MRRGRGPPGSSLPGRVPVRCWGRPSFEEDSLVGLGAGVAQSPSGDAQSLAARGLPAWASGTRLTK